MDIFIRNHPYTGPVKAVVLDWAGTAVDYGCMGPVEAFVELFKTHGVSVSAAEARRFMGLHKKDHIRAMCQTESVARMWQEVHGTLPAEKDVKLLYREVEALMVSAVAKHCEPVPGLVSTLAAFRRRNIKIGSTTGYTRPIMEILVPAAREKGFDPDSVVCSSDVPAGRPYPWMCYQNAVNLEIHPLEAMVKIGDTISDIEEGLNACMWTIGVTMTGNELGLGEEEAMSLDPVALAGRLSAIERKFREAGAHFVANGIGHCNALIDEIEVLLREGITPDTLSSR